MLPAIVLFKRNHNDIIMISLRSLFVLVAQSVFNLQGEAEEEDENLPIQEVSFDPEKAQCCVVENGQGLTHGSGGKGYGLASTGISSGCYQWKVQYSFVSSIQRLLSLLLWCKVHVYMHIQHILATFQETAECYKRAEYFANN